MCAIEFTYDNRDRLTDMKRGVLTADNSDVPDANMLSNANLAGRQQWSDLDHRGNWNDFRERIRVGTGTSTAMATKIRRSDRNATNEYTCIDPLAPLTGITTLCEFRPAHVIPAYDFAGNMTFNPLARVVGDACIGSASQCGTGCYVSAPTCGASGQEYAYDEENRVVGIYKDTDDYPGPYTNGVPNEPKLLEFKYDALGRRVETIEYVDPQTGATWDGLGGRPPPRHTRHIYSGLETVQEYACGPGTASWGCGGYALIREFVWGDSNRFPEPVAMIWHSLAEAPPPPPLIAAPHHAYHFLRDALGSVTGLTDSSGNLVERYTYDPYGKTYIERFTNGTWVATNASSYGNPFGFTGQRLDAATGTYGFPNRIYLPILGRWGQRDPIEYDGGSINLYEYISSNPLGDVDPTGEFGTRFLSNYQECIRLLQKIQTVEARIARRETQLKENPRSLPERCPGDKENPGRSRWGHRMMISEDKASLAALQVEYWWKCQDKDRYPLPGVRLIPVPFPAPQPISEWERQKIVWTAIGRETVYWARKVGNDLNRWLEQHPPFPPIFNCLDPRRCR